VKSNNNDTIKIWQPLALSVMLAIGMMFGYKMNDRDQGSLISFVDESESSASIGQVEELIRFIETRYVDSIDREVLVEKAMEAVLDDLDPHTVYISPNQLSGVNDEMEGRFRGIGVEIFYLKDTVNIINTVKDGPAEKAGIKSFDKLISINDSIVAGQDLAFSDIRKMLKGDIGDKLSIDLITKEGDEKTVNIVIDDIPVSSVKGGVMVDDITGYIKIDRFGTNTYREFMDFFQEMSEKQGMKNLIIDLRDNPGGYLPQATNILCQLFKEKGNLLVYTQGNSDKKFEYKTTGKTFFNIEDITVLIDENSASGSEIIAGAIQDWDRGAIIGRRSFGKGLVQEQYNLSNGGAIRLTVAKYYTPTGRSIQRKYGTRDSYYQDYEERYLGGELFSMDSINNSDKELFETKHLGRQVYGGGGITPDVFIPIDSSRFDPFYSEVMSELPRFTFQKLTKSEEVITTENMMAFASSVYDQYIEDKGNLVGNKKLNPIKNSILDRINSSLIKYVDGDTGVLSYELPNDPFIKASLEYFESKGKLTDLFPASSTEKNN